MINRSTVCTLSAGQLKQLKSFVKKISSSSSSLEEISCEHEMIMTGVCALQCIEMPFSFRTNHKSRTSERGGLLRRFPRPLASGVFRPTWGGALARLPSIPPPRNSPPVGPDHGGGDYLCVLGSIPNKTKIHTQQKEGSSGFCL